jgi:hypothetical protein
MILSDIGVLKLIVSTHSSSNNGRRSPFTNIYGSPLFCYCKQNPCVSLAAEREEADKTLGLTAILIEMRIFTH